MGISIGPKIVTENLLLNMDAESSRCFGGVNFVANSSYTTTDWKNGFSANTTIAYGYDAPDGTNTALRVTCANTGSSLIRVDFPAFTPNGTDNYVSSFYARLITPNYGPGALITDLNDLAPSRNYGSSLVANTWVRVETTGVPSAASKSFIDLISNSETNAIVDFWGVQVEPGRVATPLTTTTGSVKITNAGKITNAINALYNYQMTPYGGTYWDVSPERFETTAVNQTANTGIIVSPTLSFPDVSEYTLEFWVKLRQGAEINNHSLSGRNGTISWIAIETQNTTGNSWRIRYRNYAGTYIVFSSQTTPNIQTSWVHIVLTVNSSRNITLYVNGVNIETLSSATTQLDISRLAAGYNSGGNSYALQGAMAVARVYAKVLSANEIADSYRADRTRFGLS